MSKSSNTTRNSGADTRSTTASGGVNYDDIVEFPVSKLPREKGFYNSKEDKIYLPEGSIERLREALAKVKTGSTLNVREEELVRTYAHELMHQRDYKLGLVKGVSAFDPESIQNMEIVNEIRSWAIASRLTGKDATPKDLFAAPIGYKHGVNRTLQIVEAAGLSRKAFISEIQRGGNEANVSISHALAVVSKGRLSERESFRIVEGLLSSADTKAMLERPSYHVMTSKECADLLNSKGLNRGMKMTRKELTTPIDYMKHNYVSMTPAQQKRYKKYFGL